MQNIRLDKSKINSRKLVKLYDFWEKLLKGTQEKCALPLLSSIDPILIPAPCLPNITLMEVHYNPFDITIRLSGTEIIRFHEKEQKGARLLEVTDSSLIQPVFDWYAQTALKGRAQHAFMGFITQSGAKLNAERVSLPFVDETGQVKRLLSCIDFLDI